MINFYRTDTASFPARLLLSVACNGKKCETAARILFRLSRVGTDGDLAQDGLTGKAQSVKLHTHVRAPVGTMPGGAYCTKGFIGKSASHFPEQHRTIKNFTQ